MQSILEMSYKTATGMLFRFLPKPCMHLMQKISSLYTTTLRSTSHDIPLVLPNLLRNHVVQAVP